MLVPTHVVNLGHVKSNRPRSHLPGRGGSSGKQLRCGGGGDGSGGEEGRQDRACPRPPHGPKRVGRRRPPSRPQGVRAARRRSRFFLVVIFGSSHLIHFIVRFEVCCGRLVCYAVCRKSHVTKPPPEVQVFSHVIFPTATPRPSPLPQVFEFTPRFCWDAAHQCPNPAPVCATKPCGQKPNLTQAAEHSARATESKNTNTVA